MAMPLLSLDIAKKAFHSFFREKPFLFFGTGMSCAIDNRFGMDALKDELINELGKQILTVDEKIEWNIVNAKLINGAGLEKALNSVKNNDLLIKITKITGTFISKIDKEYSFLIAQGLKQWPPIYLVKKIVESLPENDPILHTVTPNYDMLCEYACDLHNVSYTNGFIGGIEKRLDWNAARCSLKTLEKSIINKKNKHICKDKKQIRLYKVHGSLNYFFYRNNVVENNAWMWEPPNFAERVMITPGLLKYKTLQKYRQELLQSADNAIDNASHFLFLGYGFNDAHLEEYIKRKLIEQSCHGLIVTRDSNKRIEELVKNSKNLWLVCKNFNNTVGSTIYNCQYKEPVVYSKHNLWDIKEFTSNILGEKS